MLRNGAVLPVTETTVFSQSDVTTDDDPADVIVPNVRLAFVEGTGGRVQRNFVRQGFGLKSFQDRDRIEFAARLQNIWRSHTFKYGGE